MAASTTTITPASAAATATATTTTGATTIKFALIPGQAEVDILDMSAKKGIMTFHATIKPIPVPCGGVSREISHFQSQLKRRADIAGLNHGLGNIFDISDKNGDDQNLITQYCCLITEDIKTQAETYMGAQTRQAQNNQMMMNYLLASLAEKCFGKISNDHKSYTIDGVDQPRYYSRCSCPLLLWIHDLEPTSSVPHWITWITTWAQ